MTNETIGALLCVLILLVLVVIALAVPMARLELREDRNRPETSTETRELLALDYMSLETGPLVTLPVNPADTVPVLTSVLHAQLMSEKLERTQETSNKRLIALRKANKRLKASNN